MVKAYLRYVQEASWGVIVSGGGQVVVDPTGKLAITPALDTVLVWDIKTQAIVHRLAPPGGRPGESSEVTALALASDGETLAAGHANGTIHLWRLSDGEERTVLTGHRSAVTALHFNGASTLLASGSHDTNIVVWDVVGEAGVCRLRGHRDAVTDVCLLPGRKALASVSKDGSLRLWDLDMQHCVQTAIAPSGELWSVAAEAGWLFTGGAAGEVLAWRLEQASVIDAPRAPATAQQAGEEQGGAQGAGKALTGGEGGEGEGEGGEGGEGDVTGAGGQVHRQPMRRAHVGVHGLRQLARHTGFGHVRVEAGAEGGGDADEDECAEARRVVLRLSGSGILGHLLGRRDRKSVV